MATCNTLENTAQDSCTEGARCVGPTAQCAFCYIITFNVDYLDCRSLFYCSYDGEWREGAKHGRGELMFPNSRRQHGIWEQDVLVQVLVHVVNGKVVPVVTPISPSRNRQH